MKPPFPSGTSMSCLLPRWPAISRFFSLAALAEFNAGRHCSTVAKTVGLSCVHLPVAMTHITIMYPISMLPRHDRAFAGVVRLCANVVETEQPLVENCGVPFQ